MAECIFCEIATGRIPSSKVYENDHVVAFLDVGPISDGHTLVIPKVHYDRLHQCPAEVLAEMAKTAAFLAGPVVQAVGAEGYNVLCNNDAAAGQVVNHVHVHIIPRKKGDGVLKRWPSYTYPEGKAREIAEKIKQNL